MNATAVPTHADHFTNELQYNGAEWTSRSSSSRGSTVRTSENVNPNFGSCLSPPKNDNWLHAFGQSTTPSFSSNQPAPQGPPQALQTGSQQQQIPKPFSPNAVSKFQQWLQGQQAGSGGPMTAEALPSEVPDNNCPAPPATRFPGQPIYTGSAPTPSPGDAGPSMPSATQSRQPTYSDRASSLSASFNDSFSQATSANSLARPAQCGAQPFGQPHPHEQPGQTSAFGARQCDIAAHQASGNLRAYPCGGGRNFGNTLMHPTGGGGNVDVNSSRHCSSANIATSSDGPHANCVLGRNGEHLSTSQNQRHASSGQQRVQHNDDVHQDQFPEYTKQNQPFQQHLEHHHQFLLSQQHNNRFSQDQQQNHQFPRNSQENIPFAHHQLDYQLLRNPERSSQFDQNQQANIEFSHNSEQPTSQCQQNKHRTNNQLLQNSHQPKNQFPQNFQQPNNIFPQNPQHRKNQFPQNSQQLNEHLPRNQQSASQFPQNQQGSPQFAQQQQGNISFQVTQHGNPQVPHNMQQNSQLQQRVQQPNRCSQQNAQQTSQFARQNMQQPSQCSEQNTRQPIQFLQQNAQQPSQFSQRQQHHHQPFPNQQPNHQFQGQQANRQFQQRWYDASTTSASRPVVSFDQFAFKPHNSNTQNSATTSVAKPPTHIHPTGQSSLPSNVCQPAVMPPHSKQAFTPSHSQQTPVSAHAPSQPLLDVQPLAKQQDYRDCKINVEPFEDDVFKVSSDKKMPLDVWQKLAALPNARQHNLGWVFPSSVYQDVVQFLRRNPDFVVEVEEAPLWVLQCIPAYRKQVKSARKKCTILDKDGDKEPGLQGIEQALANRRSYGEDKALMPYQIDAILFGIRNGGRVLIGDEMGLGKTVEALILASCYPEDWPCLIVVPSSVRFGWRDEALEWLNVVPEEVTVVKTGKDVIPSSSRVVIISYDLLSRANNSLDRRPDGQAYKVVILDECHYIKSRDSQRTKACLTILHDAKRAILLSGTPSLNEAAELYTQFSALIPEICPSYTNFAERFAEKTQMAFGRRKLSFVYRGSKRTNELNVMLKSTIMIRRLKAEVLTQLPKKRRQKVKLEVKPTLLKELKAMMAQNGIKDDTNDLDLMSMPEANENIASLFQKTTEAKLPAIRDYVEYLVNVGSKFLVFAHHIFCIDEIEAKVKEMQVDYIRIDGRVAMETRETLVRKFNEGGTRVPVAILSITACGQGLNLQSCSTVVFAELYWVPGQMIQAEDRVHRLGQQASSVNIHYLVVEDSVDSIMYNTLCRKHKDLSAMLDGQQKTLAAANVSSMGTVEVASGRCTETARTASSRTELVISGGHLESAQPSQPGRSRKRAAAEKEEPDPKQLRIDTFFKRRGEKNSVVADHFNSMNIF